MGIGRGQMSRKTKRWTTQQIIVVLLEAETCGKPVQDFVRDETIAVY